MAIVAQRITRAQQKDKRKQVPFQLLGPRHRGIEYIAQHDVTKHQQYQQQGQPRHSFAHPFVKPVDEMLESVHVFCIRIDVNHPSEKKLELRPLVRNALADNPCERLQLDDVLARGIATEVEFVDGIDG